MQRIFIYRGLSGVPPRFRLFAIENSRGRESLRSESRADAGAAQHRFSGGYARRVRNFRPEAPRRYRW